MNLPQKERKRHQQTLSSSSFLCIIGDVDPLRPSEWLNWIPTSWTTCNQEEKSFTSRKFPVHERSNPPWAIAEPVLYSELPAPERPLQVARSAARVFSSCLLSGHRWRYRDSGGALCGETCPWCFCNTTKGKKERQYALKPICNCMRTCCS